MGFLRRGPKPRIRLRLFADYRQFYVQDERAPGDLSEAWTAQATDDRIAVAPGVFGVGTESADDVDVWIEPVPAAPTDDAGSWDHVTECSVDAPSGIIVVAGCTDYFPDARRISVPAGTLRARVSHQLTGKEAYRVQLWPDSSCAPVVLKRWSPPPPPPPPAAATKLPRTLKKAAQQARLANTEVAMEALRALSTKGDAAASASLAELLVFRGEWQQMVPFALDLLGHPDAVYAGNVFFDMCLLVRRAAEVLGDPAVIDRAAATAPAKMRDVVQKYLLDGWSLHRQNPANAEERARYEKAAADATTGKRFKGKPDALARHIFALASVFHVHDEMVKQWPEKAHLLDFNQAVGTARILARRGEPEKAWRLIESMLPKWWPVDNAQVAPVELLYDPDLAPLMTPARCALVLATPRGPEAG